ncbi:MAG: DUF4423 domain-containing protein [Bryobacteraceae bacterium]
MTAAEISAYVASVHVPDDATLARQEHLRHWTAEALAVIGEPVHYRICRMTSLSTFRADVRWIAAETGVSVDEVNLALQRLLRLGLLKMRGNHWSASNLGNEAQFKRTALRLANRLAAEHLPQRQGGHNE